MDLAYYKDIPQQKLPTRWFKYYVVYKYRWWKTTYIVGSDSEEIANKLQTDLLTKPDLERCELFGHYPKELL